MTVLFIPFHSMEVTRMPRRQYDVYTDITEASRKIQVSVVAGTNLRKECACLIFRRRFTEAPGRGPGRCRQSPTTIRTHARMCKTQLEAPRMASPCSTGVKSGNVGKGHGHSLNFVMFVNSYG